MREYCLDELFDLQMGKTPSRNNSAYWNNGSNDWISIGDLSGFGKYVGETKEQLTDLAVSESGIKSIPVDTVVMSFKLSIGKLAITTEEIYSNEAIMAFIDKEVEKISPDYLYYLLLSKDWNEGTNKAVMGKTLNKATLSKVKIKLHEFSEQEEIVLVLDKANKLITLRKQQLEDLDNLIKSRFVEMFGDPVSNTKEWEMKTIIDECDCMVPGRDKPKSFTGNIPWITIDDLQVNGITLDSKKGMGLTQNEIDYVKRKTVPAGSVLMSCVGNLGICSIAGKDLIINQQLHSFQCKNKLNNYYLMHYLGYRIDYMNKHASSTTVLYMNKGVCNSIPLMLPPIDIQNEFSTFVQQVDKLKSEVQKTLDETQILFNSLMQRYFE